MAENIQIRMGTSLSVLPDESAGITDTLVQLVPIMLVYIFIYTDSDESLLNQSMWNSR